MALFQSIHPPAFCERCGRRCARWNHRFCSNECRRDQVQRVCEVCGTRFRVWRNVAERGFGRFCSRQCRYAGLKPKTQPVDERLWARVQKTEACWLWQGMTSRKGYGLLRVDGRTVQAHRMAYELAHGAIPADLCVCHRCDTPRCVNPDHLFLGTHQDNVRDRNAKGRQARGESHSRAKLTAEQIRDIRARYARGGISQRELAADYGLTKSGIAAIVSGRSWRHLSD